MGGGQYPTNIIRDAGGGETPQQFSRDIARTSSGGPYGNPKPIQELPINNIGGPVVHHYPQNAPFFPQREPERGAPYNYNGSSANAYQDNQNQFRGSDNPLVKPQQSTNSRPMNFPNQFQSQFQIQHQQQPQHHYHPQQQQQQQPMQQQFQQHHDMHPQMPNIPDLSNPNRHYFAPTSLNNPNLVQPQPLNFNEQHVPQNQLQPNAQRNWSSNSSDGKLRITRSRSQNENHRDNLPRVIQTNSNPEISSRELEGRNIPHHEKRENFNSNQQQQQHHHQQRHNKYIKRSQPRYTQLFRVGDCLIIPNYFPTDPDKSPFLQIVSEKLGNLFIPELTNLQAHITVKETTNKETPGSNAMVPEPTKVENPIQSKETPPQKPAEPTTTPANDNQPQLSKTPEVEEAKPSVSFSMQMKKSNVQQQKAKLLTVSPAFKKKLEENLESENDQIMFEEHNDLIHNTAASKNLKQKLSQLKEKIERNANETKLTKLTFEVDTNPVATFVGPDESSPSMKKESAQTSGTSKEEGAETVEQEAEEKSPKKKQFKSTKPPLIKVCTYKLIGQDYSRYTREKNILEKIETYLGESKRTETEDPLDSSQDEGDDEAEAKKQLDEFYSFENRYFISNPTKVCFRCKQAGHFERMCPEMFKTTCIFCLEKHEAMNCQSIVCFRCYKVGHRQQDCPGQDPSSCLKCNKRGHKIAQCGTILAPRSYVFDSKPLQEKKTFKPEVLCIACGNYGHANCKTDNEKVDKLYLRDDILDEELRKEWEEKKNSMLASEKMLIEAQGEKDVEAQPEDSPDEAIDQALQMLVEAEDKHQKKKKR